MSDLLGHPANVIFLGVLLIAAIPFAAYFIGLSFSRGFHRGKKEFLVDVIKTTTVGKEQKTHG